MPDQIVCSRVKYRTALPVNPVPENDADKERPADTNIVSSRVNYQTALPVE